MNKLVERLSAHGLAAWDTENHFRAMAATGDVRQALAVSDRLDAVDAAASQATAIKGRCIQTFHTEGAGAAMGPTPRP